MTIDRDSGATELVPYPWIGQSHKMRLSRAIRRAAA